MVGLLTLSLGLLAAADPDPTTPSLVVGGTVSHSESAGPVVLDSDLTLTGPVGATIDTATVSIQAGFSSADDRLGIDGQTLSAGVVEGLAWSYDGTSGILTLSGDAALSVYEAALRQVTYDNAAVSPATSERSVNFVVGGGLYFEETQHFYEFVDNGASITWHNARDQAASRSLFGLGGYLVTVTSAAEQGFVEEKLNGYGWFGASDDGHDKQWFWETGPEAGTWFFTQGGYNPNGPNSSGFGAAATQPGNFYSNWAGAGLPPNPSFGTEPNDYGPLGQANRENFGHFYPGGEWNDFAAGNGSVRGYVVEYGGLPGDPSVSLTGQVTVLVGSVNTEPEVGADSSAIMTDEGTAATNTGTSSDPDGDTVILSADIGSLTDNNDGTWSWSNPAPDGPAGPYDVTITADDGNSGTATTTFAVTVENVAPTVAADAANVTVDEADEASNTGTFGDVGDDTVAITASIGAVTQNDGAGTWSWTHTPADGPDDSQTVTITATDSDGAVTTTTFDLTVDNDLPSIEAGEDQQIDEGDTVELDPATFTDPSSADTHTATVDWGDGSAIESATVTQAGAAASSDGTIYVIDQSRDIVAIDRNTGARSVVATPSIIVDARMMKLDETTDQLVVADNRGQIVLVDIATGTETLFASGGFVGSPWGVDIASDGDVIVASYSQIVRIDRATGARSVLLNGGCSYAVGVEAAGTVIYSDICNRTLNRIDASGGTSTVITSSISNAFDIAFGPLRGRTGPRRADHRRGSDERNHPRCGARIARHVILLVRHRVRRRGGLHHGLLLGDRGGDRRSQRISDGRPHRASSVGHHHPRRWTVRRGRRIPPLRRQRRLHRRGLRDRRRRRPGLRHPHGDGRQRRPDGDVRQRRSGRRGFQLHVDADLAAGPVQRRQRGARIRLRLR